MSDTRKLAFRTIAAGFLSTPFRPASFRAADGSRVTIAERVADTFTVEMTAPMRSNPERSWWTLTSIRFGIESGRLDPLDLPLDTGALSVPRSLFEDPLAATLLGAVLDAACDRAGIERLDGEDVERTGADGLRDILVAACSGEPLEDAVASGRSSGPQPR